MSTGIRVTGIDDILRDIADLADDLRDVPDMATIAKRTAVLARKFAPRRSGHLAASIKPIARKPNRATVVATAVYSAPIHWGWPKRRIEPNPFLQRADTAARDEAIATLTAAIDQLTARRNLT